MRWSPAAPISARAFLVNSRSRSGLRDSACEVRSAAAARDATSSSQWNVEGEAVLGQELLFGLALVGAGDVRGRDGDQVRPSEPTSAIAAATREGPRRLISTAWVSGASKDDRGRGVDDDVGRGQGGAALVVEAEAVAAHVAGHGSDPSGHLVGEAVAELGPQAVEAVVLDHLAGQPGRGVGPSRPGG